MSDLYTATMRNGKLFCGLCGKRMGHPQVLVENGTAGLVECPHCWQLNKVKNDG